MSDPSNLETYLQETQNAACEVSGLIEAATLLHDQNVCKNGLSSILRRAEELAADINARLDSMAIPKGEIQ